MTKRRRSGSKPAQQRGMTEAARQMEAAHTRPSDEAIMPRYPFPPAMVRGLWISVAVGAVVGALFGAMLAGEIIVLPGTEQLYSMGDFTFLTFWAAVGIAAGVLFGGVGTLLATRAS